MVSPPEKGESQGGKYADNNIIISDSTLRNIFPLQHKKSVGYKAMCGCKCCISVKIINYYLLSWWDCYIYIKNSSKIYRTQILLKVLIAYLGHIKTM